MNNMEIWKDIPGFSRYQASNNGNLRSVNYKNSGKTKNLKPCKSKDGYLKTVLLNDEGKYKNIQVHRMIMLSFFGHSELEVNHINGITDDNSLLNLEYVTHSENLLHAYKIGLQLPSNGSKNGNSKLTEKQVLEIRKYVNEIKSSGKRYWNRKEIAAKYGVSEYYIKEIVMNRTTRKNVWSHI